MPFRNIVSNNQFRWPLQIQHFFSFFESEINFEDFQAWYNRTQEYFLWTVASKHPIRVNLVIRNCWTHEKEIQFLTICILSENNIFVPKSPSVSISIQVHSVQLFTKRFYLLYFEINPFYFFLEIFPSQKCLEGASSGKLQYWSQVKWPDIFSFQSKKDHNCGSDLAEIFVEVEIFDPKILTSKLSFASLLLNWFFHTPVIAWNWQTLDFKYPRMVSPESNSLSDRRPIKRNKGSQRGLKSYLIHLCRTVTGWNLSLMSPFRSNCGQRNSKERETDLELYSLV